MSAEGPKILLKYLHYCRELVLWIVMHFDP
jgi:hypothetical protein